MFARDRIHARTLDLASLLAGIQDGTVVLPDFQRDFDWSPGDVRALLATVLRGWPVGSLLLMDGRAGYLQVRAFTGAPKPRRDVRWVVLDGQQRLTSLYHALHGAGKLSYAIDFSTLDTESIDSIEESLRTFPMVRWERKYPTPSAQADANLLPLTALRSSPEFYEWRDAVVDARLPSADEGIGRKLTDVYRFQLFGVHGYELPAVILPAEMEAAAIARIFERVNKTGQQLNAFDLVVATSYTPGWNLRDHWTLAKEDFPILEDFFGDDGMPILQVLALHTRGDLRERAVLGVAGGEVREYWRRAAEATASALSFLTRHCGVARPDWLPYRNMAVVLGALAWNLHLESRADELDGWFWKTGWGEAYDVASNTRAVGHFGLLRSEKTIANVEILDSTIQHATRRSSGALWRTFLCTLAAVGARDPVTGFPVVSDGGDYEAISLALPRWSDRDDAAPLHQRALSFVLALSSSVDELRTILGGQGAVSEPLSDVLASQFLPSAPGSFPPKRERFIEFLSERQRLLEPFFSSKGIEVVRDPLATADHG